MSAANVVYLIDHLGMGGAERLLALYLRHLDVERFRPRVCVFRERDGNPLAPEIRSLGVPVDTVPVRHLRDVRAVPRLAAYLRRNRTDLLHTQLEAAGTIGTITARLSGIPNVCTLHTLDEIRPGEKAGRRLAAMWWALRHFADRIVAVSEWARQHYLRTARFRPEQVIALHNGVALAPYARAECDGVARERIRRELQIPANARLIMTVAVLRRPKGIQYLIEALPHILTRIPDAHYVIVGAGDFDRELRELSAAHRLDSQVTFAGARTDIPDVLAAADLFVLPTLDDALPTVLMEAMAASRPIVASRVGGVPEMVEHERNGLLVPPADPEALAQACGRLLEQPELMKGFGRAGRAIAAERFDVTRQISRLADLYTELMAERGGGR